MKKLFLLLILIVALYPTSGRAGVNVNIGIGFPPPIVFEAPPPVVVVPGQPYVYYVPDIRVDLFFYSGYWYRPYEGHWYRSRHYDRGWAYVDPRRVPRPLYHLPPDYRHRSGYEVPHGELNHNWSKWQKERYWDHYQGQGHYHRYQYNPNQGQQHQQYNKQGHGHQKKGQQ